MIFITDYDGEEYSWPYRQGLLPSEKHSRLNMLRGFELKRQASGYTPGGAMKQADIERFEKVDPYKDEFDSDDKSILSDLYDGCYKGKDDVKLYASPGLERMFGAKPNNSQPGQNSPGQMLR